MNQQTTNRIDTGGNLQQECAQMTHQVEHAIAEQPVAATMATFAVGIATGVCIGMMIGNSSSHLSTSEQISRRVMDSLHGMVPSSFSR
ncbi:hypothetical protein [Rubinisphaera italica]|uniref:Uncharacterized protein n=1 Tax=Rubinisphaera italica TaxID=2527969 RepID=A0A5C5XFH0_9PLAN|nr:hypothetical protein [Rubinisphaera italica]TWT61399.1 hypothetical protein Pan54_21350 [Rubinisphaera italica]